MGNILPEYGVHALINGGATVIAASMALAVLWGLVSLIGHLAGPFRWLRNSLTNFAKGATYITGTRYSAKARWTIFFAWTVICSVGSAFGPPYLTIAALGVGLLLVAFIVRHWTWDVDEKDREVAVGTSVTIPSKLGNKIVPVKQVDIEVNLTPETIAGFLFLFMLAGIGFARIDQSYDCFKIRPCGPLSKSCERLFT